MKKILVVLSIAVILISCAGGPDAEDNSGIEEQSAVVDLNFDRNSNVLAHRGWRVAVPPDWSFLSSAYSAENGELFRTGTPDWLHLSVLELNFDFDVDFDNLIDTYSREVESYGKVIDSGELEKTHMSLERSPAYYWSVETDRGKSSVLLEGTESPFFEWRTHRPAGKDNTYDEILETIYLEAVPVETSLSLRFRPSGFGFSSQRGPWRWAGDLGDGLLLEKMVRQGEPRVLVAVFSPDSLEDDEAWIAEETADAEVQVPVEFMLAGRPVLSTALVTVSDSQNVNENKSSVKEVVPEKRIRAIIPVPGDGVYPDISIMLYSSGLEPEEPVIEDLLDSDSLIELLQYQLVLPVVSNE